MIVIGLLGAIALIVIAAINPIEQANRARDTRFKADGGQLISAIERYFAARSEFPWMAGTSTLTVDSAFGFETASVQTVGICAASCTGTTYGVLISSDELKTEFRDRDFIKNGAGADEQKKLKIGKATGSSSSVYACFIPLSKTTREKSCAEGKVFTITTSGARTQVATATCAGMASTWNNAWHVCIPE